MEKQCGCMAKPETISRFLLLTQCNWRNSIYIECVTCKYDTKPEGCGDVLCVLNIDSSPELLPVSDAELIWGTKLDKSECLLTCSVQRFLSLCEYSFRTVPGADNCVCPLKNAIDLFNEQEEW